VVAEDDEVRDILHAVWTLGVVVDAVGVGAVVVVGADSRFLG
jgi:hypothetical protein